MVTFDNGDLVIRIPNAGTFEDWLNLNAALFETYDYILQVVQCVGDGIKQDTCIVHLGYLASAMQRFEAGTVFAATDAIKTATVGEEVRA